MRVDEAVALLFARVRPSRRSRRLPWPTPKGAFWRRTSIAPLDLPGFDNSAVDGYAVRFEDLTPQGESVLPIRGQGGGGSSLRPKTAGRSRRQGGAHLHRRGDAGGFRRRLHAGGLPLAGATAASFCRRASARGANRRRRGEDIRAGEAALLAGRRLRPEDVGLAAALGLDRLVVRRKLKAAIFSTGDEICAPGEPLKPPAVYDANRFLLHGLLRRQGVEVTDLGILKDETPRHRSGAAARGASA